MITLFFIICFKYNGSNALLYLIYYSLLYHFNIKHIDIESMMYLNFSQNFLSPINIIIDQLIRRQNQIVGIKEITFLVV